MIRVERSKEVPTSLITEQGPGGQVEKVIEKYMAYVSSLNIENESRDDEVEEECQSVPSGRSKKVFDFKKYKDEDVKKALNDLFNKKCAYCESTYGHVHPMEVEHFRPKGRVKQDREDKRNLTGYYWLAWDWENLFPSCIHCNRIKKHSTLSDGEVLMGKGDLFPLVDESSRALRHLDSTEKEVPLIINPSLEDPQEYIEFTDDGVIRPVLTNNQESLKGKVSINVYALSRIELTQEREKIAVQIKAQIERVKNNIDILNEYPDNTKFSTFLSFEMEQLKTYMEPNEIYSMMAKQIIGRFCREYGLQLP